MARSSDNQKMALQGVVLQIIGRTLFLPCLVHFRVCFKQLIGNNFDTKTQTFLSSAEMDRFEYSPLVVIFCSRRATSHIGQNRPERPLPTWALAHSDKNIRRGF